MTEDTRDEWTEHGWARVHGEAEPQPYVMRFVQAAELDELHALHLCVTARVHHPHAFRPDGRAFMEQQIERRGRTVGVFGPRGLVAYAAISFPEDDAPDNLGRDLPLPSAEIARVADYDGSAVHPDWRGNRLQQRMTDVRHRWALLHGRHHILGTVSPFNPVSLQNFLTLDCRVRNLKRKYGGMLRFIIHRDLRDPAPPAIDHRSVLDVPLSEIDRQESLLRDGFEGFEVTSSPHGPALRYGLRVAFGRDGASDGAMLAAVS